MNRYSRYIIAAVAAIASLVSCTKEPELQTGGTLPEGEMRLITVSFSPSTRTGLDTDGKTPLFSPGDKIKLSNSTRSEDCIVTVTGTGTGRVARIATNLSGNLTAVYPSTAANVSGSGAMASPAFKVSSLQTGLFKDANICTATIAENATSATFSNVTTLLKFYVDASIGVQSLTITGTANIASDGDGKTITVDPDGTALISSVTGDNPDPRLCYVSILPGVNANTLTFTSVTTGQGQGTVTRKITTDMTLAVNRIYEAFIPYYIKIKVKSSPEVYQYWAYCNVGAFLPEDYGRYFMWGETVGQVPNGNAFSFPSAKYYTADNSTWSSGKGFAWENCPWTNGICGSSSNVFTKYTASKNAYAKSGTADGKTVLDLVDDAAYVNWGADWRMPTGGSAGEFGVLRDGGAEHPWETINGVKGRKFIDLGDTNNYVFFPAAGLGSGSSFSQSGEGVRYWSSTLVTDTPTTALGMGCGNGQDFNSAGEPYNRFLGRCIRPIYDPIIVSDFGPYTDEGDI